VPALQDVLPGPHGKQQRAFLLDDGNALRACARIEPAGLEPVELHATRKRLERAGDELQQCGLAAGVGPQDRHQLALPCLKARGLERKERRLAACGGISVAGLLDRQSNLLIRPGPRAVPIGPLCDRHGRLWTG